jgi:anti-sigma regulatory factor (Ser/Thr protein kinase)
MKKGISVTMLDRSVTKKRKSRDNPAIRNFILHQIASRPTDIANAVAKEFGVSRMTANRYLDKLVENGLLTSSGATKARTYGLATLAEHQFIVDINANSAEDVIWRERIAPLLKDDLPENIIEIYQYGCTEMINNVIDHSQSKHMAVLIKRDALSVEVSIRDFGVGIFRKIASECHLNDEREAILELAKGKLTTDPTKHTGEGIFFTSRMFTRYTILSWALCYVHFMEDGDEEGDWLLETKKDQETEGTAVHMKMSLDEKHTSKEVFEKYGTETDGYQIFSKTHVPVKLARYPNEQLVSRSQARRVLTRFNKFSEVILDFVDVPTIGQAFADEIFRVFRNEHPEIAIMPIRMSQAVRDMIKRVAPELSLVSPEKSASS